MKKFTRSLFAILSMPCIFVSAASSVETSRGVKGSAVLFAPQLSYKRPYKSFAPYELPFRLPNTIKPNTPYRSASFYAVILKFAPAGSEQDCDRGEYSSAWENERKRIQRSFTQRKVFADQQCPDMGAVSYGIDGKPNTRPFIAIYGGLKRKEAEMVRAKVKKNYKNAQIKPMFVSFEQIMQ